MIDCQAIKHTSVGADIDAMTQRLAGFVLILGILALSGYAALENARKTRLSPREPITNVEIRAEAATTRSSARVPQPLPRLRTAGSPAHPDAG